MWRSMAKTISLALSTSCGSGTMVPRAPGAASRPSAGPSVRRSSCSSGKDANPLHLCRRTTICFENTASAVLAREVSRNAGFLCILPAKKIGSWGITYLFRIASYFLIFLLFEWLPSLCLDGNYLLSLNFLLLVPFYLRPIGILLLLLLPHNMFQWYAHFHLFWKFLLGLLFSIFSDQHNFDGVFYFFCDFSASCCVYC